MTLAQINSLVHHIVAKSSNDYPTLAKLMVKCLDLLPLESSSDFARVVADEARRYWRDGVGSDESLTRARVQCWKAESAMSRAGTAQTREYYELRVIIFTLDAKAPTDGNYYDEAGWFVEILQEATGLRNDEEFVAAVMSCIDQ